MLDYALTMYCTELIGQIHQSKGNIPVQRALAIDYYRLIFAIWFGARYIPIREAIHIDSGGYVDAFQRASEREKFGNLIDYNDPLGWNRLPTNYDKQGLINFMGGVDYYNWILEQTKDPAAYKAAVDKFLLFTESVKHDPAFLKYKLH